MAESAENDTGLAFALRPGTVIGHYTIRRMLGHGGFGITYAAEHRVIGRRVAIKELYPVGRVHRDATGSLVYSKAEATTIAWALDKFETTTTTLCGLDHPNIVRVHDYLKANETGYMIMELLDGLTLENWLKRRESLPSVDDLMPLVEPVMDALAYVHGQGLVHRDVAPDNILITDKGRPVLIDFGSVSRDLGAGGPQTRSGTIGLSKRHYTAPEQMRAKAKPTPEADIYSMGAVLYRALAGTAPADGLDRVLGNEGDPHEPLAVRCPAGCPMPAAHAIDKALALRPEERYRGMVQLRDGMKALPPTPPAPAPPPPLLSPSPVPGEAKRRPRVSSLVTTAALAVAGLVLGAMLAHAIIGVIAAIVMAGFHRLYVLAAPSRLDEPAAERRTAESHASVPLPAEPSPDPSVLAPYSAPAAVAPPPEPAAAEQSPESVAARPRRARIPRGLVAQLVIGLAMFVLARAATGSAIGGSIAAFGAVLVFGLAAAEKPKAGASGDKAAAGGATPGRRARAFGRGLLVAGIIAIALLPLDLLFPRQSTPSPTPVVVQPTPDATPASDDGDAADDPATTAKPHTRPCRRGRHGCRK